MAARRKKIGKKSASQKRKFFAGVVDKIKALTFRIGAFGVVCLALFLCLSWLVLSGQIAKAYDGGKEFFFRQTMHAGLSVERLTIEGRNNASPQRLKEIIDVTPGEPILKVDLKRISDDLADIGWIEEARVERHFPNTIHINVKERTPVAIYKDGRVRSLIDKDGFILSYSPAEINRFNSLITVSGDGAEFAAETLVRTLAAEPEIGQNVMFAQRQGDRRWDLTLKSGVQIFLPEKDYGLAIKRLSDINKSKKLLDKEILSIDIRMDDRLIVKTKPGAVKEYNAVTGTNET